MGNDGGSIPTRRELVKEGAKSRTTTEVKEIQNERQEHFWKTCALSHERLHDPVVADGLGTLYNKAAVISHLLSLAQEPVDAAEVSKQGAEFKDRVRSLKDVVEVHFAIESDEPTTASKWVCPITNKAMGPGTKAIYIVPCGHAFAESVVKEMSGDSCLQCNEIYTKGNLIPILPASQPDKERLEQRLKDLKSEGLSHSLKKVTSGNKKRKKVDAALANATDDRTQGSDKTLSRSDVIQNADTATLTTKILAEQDTQNKKRKLLSTDNVKSLFSNTKTNGKNTDYMTRGYSIPAGAKR